MSLGVNRNTPSQPIKGKQQASAASAAQGAGKTAKPAPTSGGDKADKNDEVKDVANISTDVQVVGTAATLAFVAPSMTPLIGTVAVKALQDTVATMPATQRMYEASKQLATAFVAQLKSQG